jgi:hypothetical protein
VIIQMRQWKKEESEAMMNNKYDPHIGRR